MPTLDGYQRLTLKEFKINQSERMPKREINYIYNGKSYRYDLLFTDSPCHYGGRRFWFCCPKCHRRVGVLYCAGLYVCRHCIGALYTTQKSKADRPFHKCNKLRARLGWYGGIYFGHGDRPKGMHTKTFNRLMWQYLISESEALYLSRATLTNTKNKLERFKMG